jgi:hypothetical protein
LNFKLLLKIKLKLCKINAILPSCGKVKDFAHHISFSIKICNFSFGGDKKLQSIKVPVGQYVYRNTESVKQTLSG